MKKAIKITSIILVVALICNMVPLHVFAMPPRGNPLNADPEVKIYNEILNEFDAKCGENPEAPISYKVKSKYMNDHREITVYNIPYMTSDKSMIKSLANVLGVCESYKQQAIDKAKANGTARNDEYIKLIRPILESSQDVKNFADSMGLPLNATINAFIYHTSFNEGKDVVTSFGYEEVTGQTMFTGSFLFMLASILSMVPGAKTIQTVAGKVCSVLGIGFAALCGVLYARGCNVTKDKLEKERARNAWDVISFLQSQIENQEQACRNKNIYITAIDKRNYSPLLFWNLGRENHSIWAGFMKLKGLESAPVSKDGGKYDEMFTEYSKAFQLIAAVHAQYRDYK